MKKIYLLLLCCVIFVCGCSSNDENVDSEKQISELEDELKELKKDNTTLKDKNTQLKNKNKSLTELASKYEKSYNELLDICYDLMEEYENTETKNNDIEIIYPELPLEVSYINSSGPQVTCRIDKISYTYDKGTCNLRLYFSGEKIYDKNGNESLVPGILCAALYDENGNIVVKNDVSLSKVKTNEKFYDCDRIFLEVPSGHTYTLKIYNYD